ncbi:zeatin O-glucosyltransferase-like [Salvia miltiorrhiza]|uniref:zeatin O-glucosyltransferase-like n=1 Tax=Salvia miltiorrhiza TaxID=226208 RepID=UPI0025AC877B|nr:zeatin O-glucosyltransferase-like [Salvia miltiorrhiza]
MATVADGHLHHRNEGGGGKVVVVMVPLPAQGHLNQLLQLSRLIAAYDIPVHYASTAAHNHQARQRAHPLAAAANIHFDDLPLPEYQSPSPNPNSANKFPSHLQPLFDAVAHLRHPVAALLRSLSSTADRVVVIHDSLMSSVVQDAASIPDAESYTFHSISAFSIFLYFSEGLETPFPINEELQKLAIPSLEDCFSREFMEFIVSEQKYIDLDSGIIFNTCREIEGEFLNSIEKISGYKCKRNWALGPFNPISINGKEIDHNLHRHECLQWLNTKERNSVTLVSFGTTTSFPDDQIEELAIGLEESGVNFIWVVREADRGDCGGGGEKPVPEGFEERVRERGMVVRDWAPQLEILGHSATGGFVTHCGWNSCIESLSMGKPIGAWPMHSDQPRNAVLMTEVLRVGVVVRDWGKRNEVLRAPAIAVALRRLMASEEMRRKAEEVGEIVRRAAAEGGATRLEMDSFVTHITR